MDKYKKARGILKGKFTRKCKLLENRLKAKDPYEVLKVIYDELSTIFKDMEALHDSIIDVLSNSSTDNASAIEEAEDYINQIETKKTEMCVAVVKCKSTNNTASVKVKSLPHPMFSGEIRKFGTFRIFIYIQPPRSVATSSSEYEAVHFPIDGRPSCITSYYLREFEGR